MNIVGPPLGKIAVIPEQYPEWNCNQAIAIFRCIDANVNPFIYQYLCAGFYLNYLHYKGMAGQDNISVTMCKELVIGLPSLSEQQAIVDKVERLIQKCQALEEQIKTSEAHAQMLMQAVLKEAFEGKQEVVGV
jgi:type I restriction enzyme S subunit